MATQSPDAHRLQKLEEQIQDLKHRLAASEGISLVVATLAPEPYELVKEIPVRVRPSEDSYVATFVDANVNASGETVNDAVDNLKDIMVALFESLGALPKARLGKGPARQLATLQAFIQKKG